MTAGARGVIDFLGSKNPALARFIRDSGMQNNVRLLRVAGEVAKYRKGKG